MDDFKKNLMNLRNIFKKKKTNRFFSDLDDLDASTSIPGGPPPRRMPQAPQPQNLRNIIEKPNHNHLSQQRAQQRVQQQYQQDQQDNSQQGHTDGEWVDPILRRFANQDAEEEKKEEGPNPAQLGIEAKLKGNEFMKQGNFDAAIEAYTKALEYSPQNPAIYLNRCLAYKKKGKFQLMYDDSIMAIECDDANYKCYMRNGEACLMMSKSPNHKNLDLVDKGLKRFQKALALIERIKKTDPSYEKQDQIISDLKASILLGNKLKWFKQRELEKNANEERLSLLKAMAIDNQEAQAAILAIEAEILKKEQLEIPNHLLCPINDDLMEEPVVISSGFTYEKATICQHFGTNGPFDPLTREEVDERMLVDNKSIKTATEEYLAKNPWAYQYFPGDGLANIVFA